MLGFSILWQRGNITSKHLGLCFMPIFRIGRTEAELQASRTMCLCEHLSGSWPESVLCHPVRQHTLSGRTRYLSLGRV